MPGLREVSDRLWLGQGRKDWADTNLEDFGTVEAALTNFLEESQAQPMKIFAPSQEILDEAKAIWQRWWAEYNSDGIVGIAWRSPDDALWSVRQSE